MENTKNIKFTFVGEEKSVYEGTMTEDKNFWGGFRIDHEMSRYSINMVEIIEDKIEPEESKLEKEETI